MCVRVKGAEHELFRNDSDARERCITFPCRFNVYVDKVMKEMKNGLGGI